MSNALPLIIVCFLCATATGLILQDQIDLAAKWQTKFESPKDLVKVCHGTSMGFGMSGSLRRHFRNMKRRYTGCTYVEGNLEITHLRSRSTKYDLDFLKTIRYVSGYVLVALSMQVRTIPLLSLEIIRGNKTLDIFGRKFSLVVSLTTRSPGSRRGLHELQMPQLREISHGDVLFSDNPALCYIRTILWDDIINDGEVMLQGDSALAAQCIPCSSHCELFGSKRCWGRGKKLCQTGSTITIDRIVSCHPSCQSRCFRPGPDGCCHKQCAAGCWGQSADECELCKNFYYEGRCIGWCPYYHDTYPDGQMCLNL